MDFVAQLTGARHYAKCPSSIIGCVSRLSIVVKKLLPITYIDIDIFIFVYTESTFTVSRANVNLSSFEDYKNDDCISNNCAQRWNAAWWYWNYAYSNLNINTINTDNENVKWFVPLKNIYNINYIEMKIRPQPH